MLDYIVLNKKPIVQTVKDNQLVTYKDLLTKSLFTDIDDNNGKMIIVEKYYVARPDLISLAVYGDDKYGDMLCKLNGLSNPFELNEGMILYIPDITTLNKFYASIDTESDILEEFKHLKNENPFNIYSSDYTGNNSIDETIEKKKKNLQKYKNERRSPGEQTVSDTNYVIDRSLGVVIY